MTKPSDEPRYRAVLPENGHPELVEEESALFKRLVDGLGDRIPDDATTEEVEAIVAEAFADNEELVGIAERLDTLIRTHKGSVIRRFAEAEERREGGS